MARFEVGDIVQLNDKYIDNRDMVGKDLTVTHIGNIGNKECIWTDPSIGGAYAADGFDLVAKGSE